MGNILENSKEFFDSMSDEDFEMLLDDMGFNHKKVEKGKGGIIYKGVLYQNITDLDKAFEEDKLRGEVWKEKSQQGNKRKF